MGFNKPPFPSPAALESFISGLETAVLALVSAFYQLPKLRGATLRKKTKESVVAVLEAVHELLTNFQQQDSDM